MFGVAFWQPVLKLAFGCVARQAQHPIAAILALTDVIASSTSSTLTGLLAELEQARRELVATQSSLGVRAGCQLFERFVRDSGAGEDFGAHKRHLVAQGRSFCRHEARLCQDKIAESTIQFLSDDCVVSRDWHVITDCLRAQSARACCRSSHIRIHAR